MTKAFLIISLIASMLSVLYVLGAGMGVTAHNHYDYRQRLLDPGNPPRHRLNPNMGLTLEDLTKCDEQVATAYRIAVADGYRLGAGYTALEIVCLGLAGLLFGTSVGGLGILKRVSGQSLERTRHPGGQRE